MAKKPTPQWLCDMPPALLAEIHAHDMVVNQDITSDCQCDDPYCQHSYPVFGLASFADPSVGIYSEQYSPPFPSVAELAAWIEANRQQVFVEE